MIKCVYELKQQKQQQQQENFLATVNVFKEKTIL